MKTVLVFGAPHVAWKEIVRLIPTCAHLIGQKKYSISSIKKNKIPFLADPFRPGPYLSGILYAKLEIFIFYLSKSKTNKELKSDTFFFLRRKKKKK